MLEQLASRTLALRHFAAFLPSAGKDYAQNRNFDWGPTRIDNTSRLSPALQRRIITEEEVLRLTLAQHSPEACEKFAQEVVWRTYWKGWLEWHPDVWENYQKAVSAFGSHPVSEGYRRALEGLTTIEPFNFWRRQLAEQGWLHNHARMWFASVWIFTLKLPWQLGAMLFLRELADADPASNTLSWRWVAGLHTAGKCYIARAENIEKFTGGRFRPTGLLNEQAHPLSEASPLIQVEMLPEFPLNNLPDLKLGLLVHSEDLSVEETTLGQITFSAIGVVRSLASAKTELINKFDLICEGDVERRLSARFQVAPTMLKDETHFQAWCDALDVIVLMEPWVGPVRERLWPWLKRSRKTLWLGRRTYDLDLIPQAKKGYFVFRKSLPKWLASIAANDRMPSVRFRKEEDIHKRGSGKI